MDEDAQVLAIGVLVSVETDYRPLASAPIFPFCFCLCCSQLRNRETNDPGCNKEGCRICAVRTFRKGSDREQKSKRGGDSIQRAEFHWGASLTGMNHTPCLASRTSTPNTRWDRRACLPLPKIVLQLSLQPSIPSPGTRSRRRLRTASQSTAPEEGKLVSLTVRTPIMP